MSLSDDSSDKCPGRRQSKRTSKKFKKKASKKSSTKTYKKGTTCHNFQHEDSSMEGRVAVDLQYGYEQDQD